MMNAFDLFLAVVTIGLAVSGFREGLIRGAIRLVGFIVTIAALALFADRITGFVRLFETLPYGVTATVVFVVCFVCAMIGIHILAETVYRLIRITPISFIDSGLGCAFGIVKAMVLCGIVALVLSLAPSQSFFYHMYRTSATAHTMKNLVSSIIPVIRRVVPPDRRYPPQEEHQDKEKNDGLV